MPSRYLRDGILTSRAVDALSFGAEVLYRRLMSVVDDYGRYWAETPAVAAACFPLRSALPDPEDPACKTVTPAEIRGWLAELERELIVIYEVDGRKYLEIKKFDQRVQGKSKFPPCSTVNHRDSPLRARADDDDDEDDIRGRVSTTTTRAREAGPVPVSPPAPAGELPSSSSSLANWPKTVRAVRDRWEFADEEILRRIVDCALKAAATANREVTDGDVAAAVRLGWRDSHRGPAALLRAVPGALRAYWARGRDSPQAGDARHAGEDLVVTRADGSVDWEATEAAMARGHPAEARAHGD